MSQGELHALALALFLPRATAASSPFRFVVLDDPIQAMDPAKIDGFVQVLSEDRQDASGDRLLPRRPAGFRHQGNRRRRPACFRWFGRPDRR